MHNNAINSDNKKRCVFVDRFLMPVMAIGDLVGSRGPAGYQWPIPYLLPFSNSWHWTWKGQWALNAWPNILITIIAVSI
jgi:hypothetical protein